MHVKLVVVFLLCYFSWCYCTTTQIRFKTCNQVGFTCLPKLGVKRVVIFECPSKTRDYYIYINEFNAPHTTESIIIRNCKTLTVLFRCSKYFSEKKNLKFLHVSNIEEVKFLNIPKYQPLLPPNVIFENITKIENIPSFTFTRTNRGANFARCALPSYNFQSVKFQNVSIKSVSAKAFYSGDFKHFIFYNVRIKILSTDAITINHTENGEFHFSNSTVGNLDPLAFHLSGKEINFSKNSFVEIPSNGLKITSDIFNFTNNSVNILHSNALHINSKYVSILSNQFQHLRTSAFSKIHSQIQAGSYEFRSNNIDFMEDDCLLPDSRTYNNTNVVFKGNTFSCDCIKSGWVLSKINEKTGSVLKDQFYTKIFHEDSENVCRSSCKLPLKSARVTVVNGKCVRNVTVENLCKKIEQLKVRNIFTNQQAHATVSSSKLLEITTVSPFKPKLLVKDTTSKLIPVHINNTLLTQYKTITRSSVNNLAIDTVAVTKNSATTYSSRLETSTEGVQRLSINNVTTADDAATKTKGATNKPEQSTETVQSFNTRLNTTSRLAPQYANNTLPTQYKAITRSLVNNLTTATVVATNVLPTKYRQGSTERITTNSDNFTAFNHSAKAGIPSKSDNAFAVTSGSKTYFTYWLEMAIYYALPWIIVLYYKL